MGCVYLIICKINKKKYIGATRKSAAERFLKHCKPGNDNFYLNSYIHRAIRKYGKEQFLVRTLFESNSWKKLCRMEKFFINKHNTKYPNGLNLTIGGDGAVGYRWNNKQKKKLKNTLNTIEYKNKISISRKRIWADPEYKAKMKIKLKIGHDDLKYRKKVSKTSKKQWSNKAARKAMSVKLKKYYESSDARKKLSIAIKEKWKDPIYRAKGVAATKKRWKNTEYQKLMSRKRKK